MITGGWGHPPVQAHSLERQGGGKSCDGGLFLAWVGVDSLGGPRALSWRSVIAGWAVVAERPRASGLCPSDPAGGAGLKSFLGHLRTTEAKT